MAHRGTPMWLGDQNAARALRLMLEHGPVSRNGLAKLAGQSKPTASQLIARLEEKRLVTPIGQEAIGRGPAATVYAPSSDRFYGVAINIDQSGVRSTAVDVLGTEHPVASQPAEGLGGDRSAARDVGGAVLAACELAGIDLSRVDTVCIGVPSSVDRRFGNEREAQLATQLGERTDSVLLVSDQVAGDALTVPTGLTSTQRALIEVCIGQELTAAVAAVRHESIDEAVFVRQDTKLNA